MEDKMRNKPAFICMNCLDEAKNVFIYRRKAQKSHSTLLMRNIQHVQSQKVVRPPPIFFGRGSHLMRPNPVPVASQNQPAPFPLSSQRENEIISIKESPSQINSDPDALKQILQPAQGYQVNLRTVQGRRYELFAKVILGRMKKPYMPIVTTVVGGMPLNTGWESIYKHIVTQDKKAAILSFGYSLQVSALLSEYEEKQQMALIKTPLKQVELFYLIGLKPKSYVPEPIALKLGFLSNNVPNLILGVILFADQKLHKKRHRMLSDFTFIHYTSLQRVPFLRRNLRKMGVQAIYKQDYYSGLPPSYISILKPTSKPSQSRFRNTNHSFSNRSNAMDLLVTGLHKQQRPVRSALPGMSFDAKNLLLKSFETPMILGTDDVSNFNAIGMEMDMSLAPQTFVRNPIANVHDTGKVRKLLKRKKIETSTENPYKKPHSKKSYTCKICLQPAFITLSELLRHRRLQHPETVNIFNCSKCPKQFKSSKRYMRHMATHENPASAVLASNE